MVSYRNGLTFRLMEKCLNPYCSGQWSRTSPSSNGYSRHSGVLILVVVDNGLVQANADTPGGWKWVLILIVVEDGLVLIMRNWTKLNYGVLILVVVEDGLVQV